MAEKQTNKERLKDITDSIEQGIQDLFQSDKYAEYLRTMSRFHKYSVNNTMLIYMQKPDATLVAGFNKWRNQFERNVMKGEKGIKIIAPTPYKKKIEQEKRDPDTNLPMLDANGRVITEEKKIKIPMFKPVTVFDVSQTDGKPLPQLASNLTGDVQNFDVFMEALRRTSPVPIDIKPIADGADGFFSLDNQRITIREGMSEVQTVSAVVHEIAHSKLHNQKKVEEPKGAEKYQEVEILDIPALFSNGRIAAADIPEGLYRYDLRGSDYDPGMPVTVEQSVMVNHAGTILTSEPLELCEDGRLTLTEDEGLNFVGGEISAYQFLNEQRKDRNTEEVEAESISFAVCAYYGIATGENSFGYIATWSKDKELKELRASLETINKTSSELISDIDRHYAEITKEREAEVEVAEPTISEPVLQSETEEALYLVDDTVYLHVQHTDEGWDYSLYDKETKKLIDGGILDPADIESSPVSSLAGAVRTEIFALQGMTPTKVVLEDIAIVDELLEAQLPQVEEAPAIAPPVEEAPPVQAPDNGYMPDPSVSIESMNAYGYTDSDMLKITSDGRKLGLDQRIINPDLPDEPTSKVNMCVDNIYRIWEEGQADKLTQLVFCDLSTPKTTGVKKVAKAPAGNLDSPELRALEHLADKDGGMEEETEFTVYDDIRDKLVAKGIPREQIVFIHEANTEARKKELFGKVRNSQVRVLMGSTFKMGAGMNVQDRLIALHDLDAPWRPGDLEQRSGRIIRQGNMNPEVHIYRYVTEATFVDAVVMHSLARSIRPRITTAVILKQTKQAVATK